MSPTDLIRKNLPNLFCINKSGIIQNHNYLPEEMVLGNPTSRPNGPEITSI